MFVFISFCKSQNFGPGYRLNLFKNTPNWDIANSIENNDTTSLIRLLKTGKYDLDYEEPRFGRTLLLLSVGTDNYDVSKILLAYHANVNKRDKYNTAPIDEAVKFIPLKKNALKIILLLIANKANINNINIMIINGDTSYIGSPLMSACSDLNCAKVLLQNNANAYEKHKNNYSVWMHLFAITNDESIFVEKYMIVEKRMKIPNPIGYSIPDNSPLDIFKLLEKENFRGDSIKENAKQDILAYLHKINFPNNQLYKN
jgi:hypothetical protein